MTFKTPIRDETFAARKNCGKPSPKNLTDEFVRGVGHTCSDESVKEAIRIANETLDLLDKASKEIDKILNRHGD